MLLGRNVVEGGSVVIRLIFKNELGTTYVPVADSVFYGLYAQRKEDTTWDVVNSKRHVAVASASVVDVVLQGQDLALLSECTTKRRAVVEWRYLRDGEETVGRDMVDFEIQGLPVVRTA